MTFPVTFDDSAPVNGQDLQDVLDIIAGMIAPTQGLPIFQGTGNPNGVVTASPPAIYLNRAGGAGATIWIKESGAATSAGWIAK